jgi:tetratricopeptide (TPR) repeat protein
MVIALLGGAEPAPAKNPQVKQAEEQVEFGYKAARRGYWQEALDRFEAADELTPKQARILNNIAVALEANGRFDEARTTYRAALALDPANRSVRRNLERFEEFYTAYVATDDDANDDREADTSDRDAGSADDAS